MARISLSGHGKTVPTSIPLPPPLKALLKTRADDMGIPMTALVRTALEDYMAPRRLSEAVRAGFDYRRRSWPELDSQAKCPTCGTKAALWELIFHLATPDEFHGWDRDKTADWLAEMDV